MLLYSLGQLTQFFPLTSFYHIFKTFRSEKHIVAVTERSHQLELLFKKSWVNLSVDTVKLVIASKTANGEYLEFLIRSIVLEDYKSFPWFDIVFRMRL